MIDSFIRGILGPLGSRVLDFYIANGLWINGLLLLYALLVVFARRTFDLGRQSLVESIQKEYGPQIEHRKSESILKVLKHIRIPWERAIDPATHSFRPAEELRAVYETEHGLRRDEDLVVYCRIGERAAHTWFTLTYLLGFPNVRNYDGSWTEWGNQVGAPIEKP